VSATVKPAAQNFSSCSAPHPTLTATGTITSKNPGTVSYYWAMSDGERTKPITTTFAAAGTQAANPLTFQAWVPATGNEVLVVTSPAVVASKPAAYTVTCGPQAAPGASANATAPAAGPAKPSVGPTAPAAAPTSAKPAPAPTTNSPAPVPTTATPAPTLTTIGVTLPPTLVATPTP
jgi:hypothetical protein